MAEEQLRKTQFTYNANANLVLQTSTTVRRDSSAPTGEPETLGNIDTSTLRSQMGSRAVRTRPKKETHKEKVKRLKEKKQKERTRFEGPMTDAASIEIYDYYRPKTDATQKVFNVILNKLQKLLGGLVTAFSRVFG